MSNRTIHVRESKDDQFKASAMPEAVTVNDISLTREIRKLSVSAWRDRDGADAATVQLRVFGDSGVSMSPDEADAVADVIHECAAKARLPLDSE